MKIDIQHNLDNPGLLEKMYRANGPEFKKVFREIYPTIQHHTIASFWQERLSYEQEGISWGSFKERWIITIACILAGFLAKLPALTGISEEFFYPRNIGFIVFPALIAYFAWKRELGQKSRLMIAFMIIVSTLFINLWPEGKDSDTLLLAGIHLPLMLWFLFGKAFTGNEVKNFNRRLDFLRFNGDLVVMLAVLLISGGIVSGVTIGLFNLIGLSIEEFYMENLAAFAAPALPIVGAFLSINNPQLVSKVSPIIAKLFSPIVLLMLISYLIAIVLLGKNPYTDREFLLLFNLLLIGVMALIFFSIAGTSSKQNNRAGAGLLLLLSLVTVLVNGIALSAIVFRISEWGFTPNRLAVLGSNILMLIHLLMITNVLFKKTRGTAQTEQLGKTMANYLPVYFTWILLVIFGFPLVFGF